MTSLHKTMYKNQETYLKVEDFVIVFLIVFKTHRCRAAVTTSPQITLTFRVQTV